jgi:hypothetical protein
MSTTTYSFAEVTTIVLHPAFGQFVASGAGIGSITTTMTNDRTTHDVSADGQVMVSKIKSRNGGHALAIQQTSDFNKWLLRLYNFLDNAPSNFWAGITVIQRAPGMGEMITSTGVSFQKLPDKPYQAQGQQITWQLMAADIQQDSF